MPPLKKYLLLKLSALHSRVLSLFDTLLNKNYKCWVDNLHISINFIIHTLKHKVHVMIEGVYRYGGCRFPKIVK